MSSQPHDLPIGALLGTTNRSQIRVPEFQRGYEWEKKHVEAFWNDLIEIQTERGLTQGRRRHFFGPIVVLDRIREEITDLLDGQQRLATTTILLAVIRDYAKDIGTPDGDNFALDTQNNYIVKSGGKRALTLGETDDTHFRETVQSYPSIKRHPSLRTHRNIDAAKKLLAGKVATAMGDTSSPAAKIAFLQLLRQSVISDFAVASIPVDDEREAFKIFETLNDRGLKLAAPDLLFNLLMQRADKEERPQMRALWTEIIEDLGEHDLKDFLRAYWVSKHGDIKKSDLFTVLKERVEASGLRPLDFLRECAAEVDSYVQLMEASPGVLGSAAGPVKSLIGELNLDIAVPLLLSALYRLNRAHPENFDKLCRWMLVFVVRYSFMGRLERSGVEDIFYEQAREMRITPDPESYLEKVKQTYVGNTPDNNRIEASKIILAPTSARYMMRKIAGLMQSNLNEWDASKACNVEHIYPKSPREHEWGGQANQAIMDEYLWNIGNLTIMGKKINGRAANDEFHLKKAHYLKSKVQMTLSLASDYSEWTETQLLNRARNMTNRAKEIWLYDNLGRV